MRFPVTVSAEDLKAADWRFAGHINFGGNGGQTSYACAAFPEAAVCRGRQKSKGKWMSFAVVLVAMPDGRTAEAPTSDLDAAAKLISDARRSVADDAAWEAAAPQRATA
jgi:hypothetical protein